MPELPGMTSSWVRAIVLTTVAAVVSLLLVSCVKDTEVSPPGDYSSPLVGEYTATTPPDYSSPVATGGEDEPSDAEPRGPHTEPVDPATAPKVQTVSHGREIVVDKYLVPGKITILDFTSEFCPPCERLAPFLEELVAQRDDLYLVRVDINREGIEGKIDWSSPVSMQFTLRSIPHFKIYGPGGKIMLEGDPASQRVIEWLEEVRKKKQ